MNGSHENTPRDLNRPAPYYRDFVLREQEAMNAYIQYNNPASFFAVAPKCVRIGVALYSAGNEVSECHYWFGKAADYQRRFLAEGKQFTLGGRGNIEDYLELYSSAFLAGQSHELIATLRRCKYTETTHPAKLRLLVQFCDLLEGNLVETKAADVAELKVIKPEWAYLPVLFSAVSKKDLAKTATALDDYLVNSWGPSAEKWAKKALHSPTPDYCGKWSVFSAAACKILGTVPDLGTKAKRYVPVDLMHA